MKIWYYPWLYKLPPKDKLLEMLQSIEIPDDEGKKRLCEENQLISYEYAQHLARLFSDSNTEGWKWTESTTMEGASPDSPKGSEPGKENDKGQKFF